MADVMLSVGGFIVLILVSIWATVWTAIAMWKSARNNQTTWFVINFILYIFVLGIAGLVPILYMAFFQRNQNKEMHVVVEEVAPKKPAKKAAKKKKK